MLAQSQPLDTPHHRASITTCALFSGAVALTSINYGFFMVTPDWTAIDAEVTAAKVYGERQSFRTILANEEGATCPVLNRIQACSHVSC